MILKQRRFCRTWLEKHHFWSALDDYGERMYICGDDFAELFAIPKYAKLIWLTLRDRPGVLSMSLRIERVWFDQITVTAENGQQWRSAKGDIMQNVARLLCEYVGRTVYLEVEYESG